MGGLRGRGLFPVFWAVNNRKSIKEAIEVLASAIEICHGMI